jgi:RNA recognition motif-containing protein
LYVAHLDPRASEEDVRKLFSNHGAVLHVRIIQDRDTGQSKGYGFVTMGAPNMAQVLTVLPRTFACMLLRCCSM